MTDRVIVQRLTDYVWVGLDSIPNDTQITHVAKVFSALRTGVKDLDSYYKDLSAKDIKEQSLADSRFFPWITTYRGVDGPVEFEYLGYLENVPDCVTLRARTKSGQNIVVKFVDRYGERAHRLLAHEGLAPKLFHHGSLDVEQDGSSKQQPSGRSLSMVVMEHIEGRTLAAVKQDKEEMKKMEVKVRSELQRALELLHDQGLVFGDLRLPNVMITTKGEVKLIDFNWADVQGQARYPPSISPNLNWAPGVEALAVIEPGHDLVMLEQLFE
jgi:serine/threonine protein kinase